MQDGGNHTQLTNSMELNTSCETNMYSTSQEIIGILWNLNIHYGVPESTQFVPVLSQPTPPTALP
jgi:hypothetical protein